MGAIGGGIFQAVKGFRNSPSVCLSSLYFLIIFFVCVKILVYITLDFMDLFIYFLITGHEPQDEREHDSHQDQGSTIRRYEYTSESTAP